MARKPRYTTEQIALALQQHQAGIPLHEIIRKYWFAAMLCPCGCGDSIKLSLVPSDYPTWRFHLEQNCTPTLSPSVWRRKGCRSHFHLRHGAISWCAPKSTADEISRG